MRETSSDKHIFIFCQFMQNRSRDLSLKKLLIEMSTLFLVSLISFKAFRYIISVLGGVKILQRKGPIKGITCNGELGTSQ